MMNINLSSQVAKKKAGVGYQSAIPPPDSYASSIISESDWDQEKIIVYIKKPLAL